MQKALSSFNGNRALGLKISRGSRLQVLHVSVDVDLAASAVDRHPVSGVAMVLGDFAVGFGSSMQYCVTGSTTEAE